MAKKTSKCVICGSESSWLMNKRGYDLYKCDLCGHITVLNVPSQKELNYVYSFGSGYQKQPNFIFPNKYKFKKRFSDALESIKKYVPSGAVLDVGCSTGEFSVLAMRSGYHVVAIEINKGTAEIARKNGVDVKIATLETAKFKRSSFDAVHLSDVVEHVRDVDGFMKELNRIVKKGGIILVRTPNHDAIFPRATLWLYRNLGIPWSHPTPPYHLNQFTPKSMALLLEMYGFEAKEYYYTKCSLGYELGVTYVYSDFRQALKNKNIPGAIKSGLMGVLVIATYVPMWVIDAFITGKPDFNMNVVAKKK